MVSKINIKNISIYIYEKPGKGQISRSWVQI